jgi:hypothetical protein
VIALVIWQGVTAHGMPDPMQPDTSSTVAFMNIGILVFVATPATSGTLRN